MSTRSSASVRWAQSGMSFALALAAAASAQAASGTWTANSDGNWSDPTKWSGGTLADIADGATYTATFQADITASRTVTLDGARTIGHLSFNDTSGGNQFFIAGNNTLTIDPTGTGGGTSNWDVAAGTTGIIGSSTTTTRLAGSSTINKTGTGTILFSNSNSTNTFTGAVNITAGGVTLGSNSTAGTALQGVQLRLGGGSDNVSFNVGTHPTDGGIYSIGGTTVQSAGTGTVSINYGGGSRSVVSGGVTLNKSITINSSSSGALAFSGSISGAGAITKTGGGALDFTGQNSFTGGLVLSQGTLRMYGFNAASFSGGITVGDTNTGASNVAVSIGNNQMNAPITFTNNGTGVASLATLNGQNAATQAGAVTLNRNIVLATGGSANLTVSGQITGAGAIRTGAGSNVIVLSGTNDFSGGSVIGSGITRTGNASALGTGIVSVLPATAARLDLNNTNLGIASLWSAGLSSSTITVANQGTGYTNATVNISAPNVPGGTQATATATISGGKVTAIAVTNFGAGYTQAPTITISGDGSNAAATVPTYAASSVTLGSGSLTIKGTNATPAAYAGVISGTGGLIKEGSGTQILSGANTYAGNTAVNGGALLIDGSIASNVAVNNTGTIGGSGVITGSVAINNGATLSPGNSPGTLTISNNPVTWASGGTYAWQLLDTTQSAGTGWDLTSITGTGTLVVSATPLNPFNVSLQTLEGVSPDDPGAAAGFVPSVPQQWLIASAAGGISGWDVADGAASSLFSINAAGFVGADGTFTVVKTGNNVFLSYAPVPEPATLSLLALGLGGLCTRRRSR